MNALFMLSYMLATLLYGQVAMAQEQVSFQLQLDPILLVAGSESRDLEPRNIDALLKIKWEFAQAKKGGFKKLGPAIGQNKQSIKNQLLKQNP